MPKPGFKRMSTARPSPTKGALGGISFDDILGGEYQGYPVTTTPPSVRRLFSTSAGLVIYRSLSVQFFRGRRCARFVTGEEVSQAAKRPIRAGGAHRSRASRTVPSGEGRRCGK